MLKIKTCKQAMGPERCRWVGDVEDGRMFSIIYYNGFLSVRISTEPTSHPRVAAFGEHLFFERVGAENTWEIDLWEVQVFTRNILDWSEARIIKPESPLVRRMDKIRIKWQRKLHHLTHSRGFKCHATQ